MEVSGELHVPPAFLPRKSLVNIEWETERAQSRSECFEIEKNLLPLPGFELRLVQPVA
jgi:hypothetical protein